MSALSTGLPLFPLLPPQVDAPEDQLVVTYLDSNYVWKDYTIEPKYISVRQLSLTEREISCAVPDFWSRIPPSAHIKHVRCTVKGKTFHLPWPPSAQDPLASPELTLHVQLHAGLDQAPTYATWQEVPRQDSEIPAFTA
jgi:hypothetical protein